MVRVKVPATTANMGPGFDALGMALNIYNYIEVCEIESGVETFIECEPFNIEDKDNLIYMAMVKTFEKAKEKYKGFSINVYRCDVPMSRGLGSSATCIVGGILAANSMLKNKLSKEDMLNIANEMEGHPDNVAPALLGGMIASIQENGMVHYSRVNIPENIKCAVMIPDFKVETHKAREVLPKIYSREDAVYNISRTALFISSLNNGELDKLKYAVSDKIHEPYRGKLIRNIDDIFKESRENGSLCEFISGSGSTLLAFIDGSEVEFLRGYLEKMKNYLDGLEDKWKIEIVTPSRVGGSVIY